MALLREGENDAKIPTPNEADSESKVSDAYPNNSHVQVDGLLDLVQQQNIEKGEIGIDKKVNGVFLDSNYKSFENIPKSRMALLQVEGDDVTIKSTNKSSENLCNDLNISAGNSLESHTIKLGLFSFDLKNNISEELNMSWHKKLIVGALFQRNQKRIVQLKKNPM